VAGIATAPVAAASFNRLAEYGLLANLLAVPLMGAIIMPAAVLAAVLAPVGLHGVGLAIMEPAIAWILAVSAHVSALEGAVMPIHQPAPHVMPLLSLGALWLILWQGHARWAGALVMVLAIMSWTQSTRPTLLIAADASVVGLMQDDKRTLSRARAGSFIAESWLRSDGDGASQADAHARSRFDPSTTIVHLRGSGFDVVHLAGRRAAEHLPDLCLPGRIVVVTVQATAGPCKLITPNDLRSTGARAYDMRYGQLVMRSVAQARGHRLWAGP